LQQLNPLFKKLARVSLIRKRRQLFVPSFNFDKMPNVISRSSSLELLLSFQAGPQMPKSPQTRKKSTDKFTDIVAATAAAAACHGQVICHADIGY